MPNRVNIQKQLSRTRLQNLPSNPTHIENLHKIPIQFTQTLNGNAFLLYDSYTEEERDEDLGRILIFATRENLKELFKSSVWFLDGTFKTAPALFFQLFSILGAVMQVGINRKT